MDSAASNRRRTALVTGATSEIGAATALALAHDGFDVAVCGRAVEKLRDTVGHIEATGRRAVPVPLDLCSQQSIEHAMATVIDAFGHLDALVNNAAATFFRAAATDLALEQWEAVMKVNVTGTFLMCQQMGRHLIRHRHPGCVVNIASTHGVVGFAEVAAYGVSKAAIIHMTKMLAVEWAQHEIRVNALAPGTVQTRSRPGLANPKLRETLLKRIPLHRFGTAEEVARAACYLVSPAAAYITGHTLIMDGGLTCY